MYFAGGSLKWCSFSVVESGLTVPRYWWWLHTIINVLHATDLYTRKCLKCYVYFTTIKKLKSSNKQPQRRDQQMVGFRSSFLKGTMLIFGSHSNTLFCTLNCLLWDTSEVISIESVENNVSNAYAHGCAELFNVSCGPGLRKGGCVPAKLTSLSRMQTCNSNLL